MPTLLAATPDARPMICQHKYGRRLVELPDAPPCPDLHEQFGGTPIPASFEIYKPTPQITFTPATACQIQCRDMTVSRTCGHGTLHPKLGGWATNNQFYNDNPLPFFGSFAWRSQTVHNCISFPTSIELNTSNSAVSSALGSLTDCKYQSSACTTSDGSRLLWTPSENKTCPYSRVGSYSVYLSNPLKTSQTLPAFLDPILSILTVDSPSIPCSTASSSLLLTPTTSVEISDDRTVIPFDKNSVNKITLPDPVEHDALPLVMFTAFDLANFSTSPHLQHWQAAAKPELHLGEGGTRPDNNGFMSQVHTPSFLSLFLPQFSTFQLWVALCSLIVTFRVFIILISLYLRPYYLMLKAYYYQRKPSTRSPSDIILDDVYNPCINSVSSPSIYAQIPIRINGHEVSALLDTGASLTLMSSALAPAVGIEISSSNSAQATSASGHALDMHGSAMATVEIGGISRSVSISFTSNSHIRDTASYDLILGFKEAGLELIPSIIDQTTTSLLIANPSTQPITIFPGQTFTLSSPVLQQTLTPSFPYVFASNQYDLGCANVPPQDIHTTTEVPVFSKPHRVPYNYKKDFDEHMDKLLQSGAMRPSQTPWVSSVVLVKKKDGSLRPCIDFRKLNAVTVPERFPMPSIEDIMGRVGGCHWYSSLDLASGYWQIPLSDEAIKKCGVITYKGVY
ncbi:unnamed protein product [Bursaphelenchus okinawaensis]|uniref:Reverse transcriptase domain-containing protein n=1 Tax=Bursaphelenchus okinawaensis TaxID=465554 RepID=A0A811KTI5_9BILA|nr:unnamed protein product [Bursaphelenchus okinawaensis]CAG9113025.1 unnamed protein product [Bursaphelenchus okinawaensis]